ncbi:hypothetical protein ACE1CD_15665 [Aerosakkonema sp. BLCC-F183]|uniref:hypothetical protein n=1 Tax=Aerosakkonema sp. BLCC-F183 TaxID=3342834 RepID=UPI0035B8D4E1
MQDKDFLIENYQERFWQYQTKELNRNYQRLTLKAIKVSVVVGVVTGAFTAVILTILLNK